MDTFEPINQDQMAVKILMLFLTVSFSASGQFNKNQKVLPPIDTVSGVVKPNPNLRPAEFPGGMAEFYKYVGNETKIPKEAKKQSINGKVFVQFIIDTAGRVKKESIRVVGSLGESCEKEAIRVISNSPAWIPAQNLKTKEKFEMGFAVPIFFKTKRRSGQ